jgi:8-oxo-dGTP pyrophosphatase MutT (NUDIX family)
MGTDAPDVPAALVPRPAATVLVVRDSLDGLEVLMVRRSSEAVFFGGAHVFPGGALEPGDADPELAVRISGVDDVTASALLGVASGGLASWVAAVRECFEETGVLLGGDAGSPPEPGVLAAVREALRTGTGSLAAFLARAGLVLDLGGLRYFGHRITPPGQPRRFDTRFFVTRAPAGVDARADAVETFDPVWLAPEAALGAADRGEISLAPPTVTCLRTLSVHGAVASLLGAIDSAEEPLMGPQVPRPG